MKKVVPALLLLGLCGCDEVADIWGGLTTALVTNAVVVGVAEPDDERLDLSGTEFEPGTGFTAFLADAASLNDLESAPISGATVSVEGAAGEMVAPGSYNYAGDLAYVDGADWTMSVTVGGDTASAAFTLPPAANITLDSQHSANTALTVPLSGQPFDNALVVVIDVESGDLTYSNEPESITELYEFMQATGPSDEAIPASAFPSESMYALGITGITKTESDDLTDMNTALSNVSAGKMKLLPICTLPQQACDAL